MHGRYPAKLLTEPWQEGSANIPVQMEESMRFASMAAGFVLAAVLIAGAEAGPNGAFDQTCSAVTAAHRQAAETLRWLERGQTGGLHQPDMTDVAANKGASLREG